MIFRNLSLYSSLSEYRKCSDRHCWRLFVQSSSL